MPDLAFICHSLKRGGAAIAANNFLKMASLFRDLIDRTYSVTQDNASKIHFVKRVISHALGKLQSDSNPVKHSLNLFSYPPVLIAFKKNSIDLFHIHWINNDTLSIFDLDKIPHGSIVTLHDEWLFCGAEHCYKVDDLNLDFIGGYNFFKKNVYGIHWNHIVWRIKRHKLKHRRDLIFTVPSNWMLGRALQSSILGSADVRLLPNPIDVDQFQPFPQNDIDAFRRSLGFSTDDIILAFGAIGGTSAYLKGAHLLDEALRILGTEGQAALQKIKLVDFGGKHQGKRSVHGFDRISLGHISDPSKLALLYSSVDCVVVPSLVESFGQVAAEAMACETPVISFDYSGLADIVIHERTGLTANPYSVADLSAQLKSMITMPRQARKELGTQGRAHVVKNFSYPVISERYKSILGDAIALKNTFDSCK